MNTKKVLVSAVMLLSLLVFNLQPASASAATTVDAAVKDAVSASKKLYWSWSVEGYGDGKVQPYAEYNLTKQKYAIAVKSVAALPKSKQASYTASLESVKEQINRAMVYIDAISSGKKIEAKRLALEKMIQADILNDDTEKKYHELTYEIKKQAAMLDKVYGKTTRNKIRAYYKQQAEKVRDSLLYPITVKMKLDQMEDEIAASKNVDTMAAAFAQVVLYLDKVPQAAYKAQLQTREEQVKAKIPANLKVGKLKEALAMESEFKELDQLVSPGKSDAKVPVLYDTLTNHFKLFSDKQAELISKRDAIMSDLDVPVKVIKEKLTALSKAKGIPPEAAKAIALKETEDFTQFQSNGEVYSSPDNGYGIMQVTRNAVQENQYNWDEVKYDLDKNIEIGLDILLEKWNSTGSVLPTINSHDKRVLEDWYFAIMAYNGLGERNNPQINDKSYQFEVYQNIKKYAIANELIEMGELNTNDIKIIVNPGTGIMSFTEKMSYGTSKELRTSQLLNADDKVTLTNVSKFRKTPNTSDDPNPEKLAAGTKVSIVEAGIEDGNKFNLFNWYKVKVDGTNRVGYIASNNFYQ